MNLKAFLCDLDGTLVSSYRANFKAYRDALHEVNMVLEAGVFLQTWGQDSREFLPKIFPTLTPDQLLSVMESKAKIYPKYIPETKPNRAMVSLLNSLSMHSPVGLVTTAKKGNVDAVLEFHGLRNLFDVVISGDDVFRTKPDPEGYMLALEQLNMDPDFVLTFEDSDAGIRAADAAGISCVRVMPFED